jgi:SAM-dependent methyltransferase
MRESLFDWDPENYDRARPTYPDALFDDLWAYLDEAARAQPVVVEVGPGTGKATRSLLERGARVTAVELGPQLAAFLAQKFRAQPALSVVNAAFEDAPLPRGAWDLVFSATAYHWIASDIRTSKPHALLKAGGVLAIVDTIQVRDEADRGYFERSQSLYARYWPDQTTYHPAPDPDVVEPPIAEELRASGLFDDVRLWRYRWDQRYDADAYMSLVRSYSNTYELAPDVRERFLIDLRAFVEAEVGASVLRPLVITLVVGRRRSERVTACSI